MARSSHLRGDHRITGRYSGRARQTVRDAAMFARRFGRIDVSPLTASMCQRSPLMASVADFRSKAVDKPQAASPMSTLSPIFPPWSHAARCMHYFTRQGCLCRG